MTNYDHVQKNLLSKPKTWLITGVAGFIGSNLLEALLKLDQRVIGLDNLSTGYIKNITEVEKSVKVSQWEKFTFIEGDLCDLKICKEACKGVDFILHQAALGSVPRSINDPIATNQSNIDGFLNILIAGRDEKVIRFVYAASSSTYGDHPDLPKVEDRIGKPLSPYAVSKLVNELYADVFSRVYGIETIGLRYFNIFGRRQDPNGAYAAVIPKFIYGLINNEPIYINGDGETSRDFCYINNAIQANLLAATTSNERAVNQVYNIAVGDRTSLNNLYYQIREILAIRFPLLKDLQPVYRDFRAGDVRHSLADIQKAFKLLGYQPTHRINDGLVDSIEWYIKRYNLVNP